MSDGFREDKHEPGWLVTQFQIFLTALAFLTRLPIAQFLNFRPEYQPKTIAYFPAVGFIVGLIGAATLFLAYHIFTPAIAVIISMLATVLVTGGIHEDGLTDTLDGLGSGRDPSGCMEIMRDSRIGSFGAIGLWFSLTLKFAILSEMLFISLPLTCAIIVAAHSLGRSATVALFYKCPYISGKTSKSEHLVKGVQRIHVLAALVCLVAGLFLILGTQAAYLFVTGSALTLLIGKYFMRKLEGITGDCLGAASQIVEMGCYISFWIQIKMQLP